MKSVLITLILLVSSFAAAEMAPARSAPSGSGPTSSAPKSKGNYEAMPGDSYTASICKNMMMKAGCDAHFDRHPQAREFARDCSEGFIEGFPKDIAANFTSCPAGFSKAWKDWAGDRWNDVSTAYEKLKGNYQKSSDRRKELTACDQSKDLVCKRQLLMQAGLPDKTDAELQRISSEQIVMQGEARERSTIRSNATQRSVDFASLSTEEKQKRIKEAGDKQRANPEDIKAFFKTVWAGAQTYYNEKIGLPFACYNPTKQKELSCYFLGQMLSPESAILSGAALLKIRKLAGMTDTSKVGSAFGKAEIKLSKAEQELADTIKDGGRDLKAAGALKDEQRKEVARLVTGKETLTEAQEKSLIKAHEIGKAEGRGYDTYTYEDKFRKKRELIRGGWTPEEADQLMKGGIAGSEGGVPSVSMSLNPKNHEAAKFETGGTASTASIEQMTPLQRAEHFTKELGNTSDVAQRATYQSQIAENYFQAGNAAKGQSYMEEAANAYKKSGDMEKAREAYIYSGQAMEYAGSVPAAQAASEAQRLATAAQSISGSDVSSLYRKMVIENARKELIEINDLKGLEQAYSAAEKAETAWRKAGGR